MNILQYDLKDLSLEEIKNIVEYINDMGVGVIAIPKDINLMMDCDISTLEFFKYQIEQAIKVKKNINN